LRKEDIQPGTPQCLGFARRKHEDRREASVAVMKRPPPQPPRGAPAGTSWTGGPIPWFSMSIEIHADSLVPGEVTSLLGVAPTQVQEKGKPLVAPNGKHMRPGKFGRWSLELERSGTDEWDVAEAAKILLGRVPAEPAVWRALSSRAKIRLSVAVSLESFNQGISIDPALLRRLADREIQLDVNIYSGDQDETQNKKGLGKPDLRLVPK
jgi:Domain of unknown function (DUF4279)